MTSYIIGIIGIVGLMLIWFLVQKFWKQVFSDHLIDDDAMSGRTKCSNCGCTSLCENKKIDNLRIKN
jgi:hypothetical protein